LILNSWGETSGHAILVTPTTAIVPAHAFDDTYNILRFPGRNPVTATVIFNGMIDKLDFKWVQLPDLGITPAKLTASIVEGEAVQLSYDDKLNMNAIPFYVEPSRFLPRSHAGGQTHNGQSGSPRADGVFGCVESILQGADEGLTLNTIYQTIENYCSDGPYREHVKFFYKQFVDPQGLYTNTNTNPIQSGCVDEYTKPGLSLEEVLAANIFTQTFLDKHYARNAKDAHEKAQGFKGTVSVFRISSPGALTAIRKQVKTTNSFTPSIGWHFVNKVFKGAKEKPTVRVKCENGRAYHLDSMS
jgi:hypothetical protein